MMNKKGFLILTLISAYASGACACALTVINNTPFRAAVYNRLDQTTTKLLAFESAQIGKPDKRADVEISVHTLLGTQKEKFKLKQIACSQSHNIQLKVQDVLNGNLGKNALLFKIKKVKLGTGNKAKAA